MSGGVTSFLKAAGASLLGPAGGLLIGKTKTEKKETPEAKPQPKTSKPEKPITTDSREFYAGMTIDEAKKKKLDKSVFNRDFSDMDKNKDGILSNIEILQERKVEADRASLYSAGMACVGLGVLCVPGAQIEGAAILFGSAINGADAIRIDKENEEYAKKHNINLNF